MITATLRVCLIKMPLNWHHNSDCTDSRSLINIDYYNIIVSSKYSASFFLLAKQCISARFKQRWSHCNNKRMSKFIHHTGFSWNDWEIKWIFIGIKCNTFVPYVVSKAGQHDKKADFTVDYMILSVSLWWSLVAETPPKTKNKQSNHFTALQPLGSKDNTQAAAQLLQTKIQMRVSYHSIDISFCITPVKIFHVISNLHHSSFQYKFIQWIPVFRCAIVEIVIDLFYEPRARVLS